MVISNPTNLNGMIGFFITRRHFNDLAGQDQYNDGKEVNMVVSRGEVLLLLDKYARNAGDVINMIH